MTLIFIPYPTWDDVCSSDVAAARIIKVLKTWETR